MATMTTSINTSLLTTYLIKKFIPSLERELQFEKFTTKATLPQGMGNIARFNVFQEMSAQTTALTEGTASGNEMSDVDWSSGTDCTIAEYGEFFPINRLMELTQLPAARAEILDRMAYGAALSIDSLIRNVVTTDGNSATTWYTAPMTSGGGTPSTSRAGGATAASSISATYTPGLGSAAAVIGAAKELRDNSCRGFSGVAGHPDKHFAFICSPKFELDMVSESSTGRMTWAEANTDVPGALGQTKWVNGYMGSVYGTACYRSQNISNTTITNTADDNVLLAEGGLGSVSLVDADPQIYVNTASANDVGNPYRNSNTIAWHIYFATAMIDSNRVIRMYSAAT